MQINVEQTGCKSISAPVRESGHLHHPHRAIKTDGNNIIAFHGMCRRPLALTIDPDMAGLDKGSSAGAGLNYPRVPQPFIKTLTVQSPPHLKRQQPTPERGGLESPPSTG